MSEFAPNAKLLRPDGWSDASRTPGLAIPFSDQVTPSDSLLHSVRASLFKIPLPVPHVSAFMTSAPVNYADHLENQDPAELAAVAQARQALREVLSLKRIQWLTQVHGHEVMQVPEQEDAQAPILVCDGIWTDQARVGLAIMTADCLPVIVAARDGSAVGAAHAGWQGLCDVPGDPAHPGILAALVQQMPADPAACVAWIGPGISMPHYEVGNEVWSRFAHSYPNCIHTMKASHPDQSGEDKRWLDLAAIAHIQLQRLGLKQIFTSGLCTYTQARTEPRLYSHRHYVHSMQAASSAGEAVSSEAYSESESGATMVGTAPGRFVTGVFREPI